MARLKKKSQPMATMNSSSESIVVRNGIPEGERGIYEICCIRIYGRVLTRKERVQNHQIDETRF